MIEISSAPLKANLAAIVTTYANILINAIGDTDSIAWILASASTLLPELVESTSLIRDVPELSSLDIEELKTIDLFLVNFENGEPETVIKFDNLMEAFSYWENEVNTEENRDRLENSGIMI